MTTEQEITQLAYSLWEQEGRPNGRDREHYFTAKRLLEAQTMTLETKGVSDAANDGSALAKPKRTRAASTASPTSPKPRASRAKKGS